MAGKKKGKKKEESEEEYESDEKSKSKSKSAKSKEKGNSKKDSKKATSTKKKEKKENESDSERKTRSRSSSKESDKSRSSSKSKGSKRNKSSDEESSDEERRSRSRSRSTSRSRSISRESDRRSSRESERRRSKESDRSDRESSKKSGSRSSKEVESSSTKKRNYGTISDDEMEGDFKDDEEMQNFFNEIEYIKEKMNIIRKNMEGIEDCYNEQMWNKIDTGSVNSDKLERLLEGTNATANVVRDRLKVLTLECKNLGQDTQSRTKRSVLGANIKKFSQLMEEYQRIQTSYKDKYKQRMRKQALVVSPDMKEEEVENLIETGQVKQVFADKIQENKKKKLEAQNALIYIQEQHKDLMQLEQSITELHQLFVDLSLITEMHGEMLQQIDEHIETAVEYTSKATDMLQKAESHKIASRKKCCIIVLIIICCLLLTLLIIGAVIGIIVALVMTGV